MIAIAGSSNGRTRPSGGRYLGPSPSPAASVLNIFAMMSLWKKKTKKK